jgi:hypothetical protein
MHEISAAFFRPTFNVRAMGWCVGTHTLLCLLALFPFTTRRSSVHRPPPLPVLASHPFHFSQSPQNKRHIKRTKDNPGGVVSVESPLHYTNVSLIDPVTNAPVKASWRYLEDGTKVRVTRGKLASGSVIPRPEILTQRRKPLPIQDGPRDTPTKAATVATHTPGDLPTALRNMLEGQGSRRRSSQRANYFTSAWGSFASRELL